MSRLKQMAIPFIGLMIGFSVKAQIANSAFKFPEIKKNLNAEGTHYFKFTGLGQFWTRFTDMNPGTTLNGMNGVSPFDIGIRRLRFNGSAQLTDRVFFYVQFGQNNFGYTSKLYSGSFFHDAVGEYRVHKTGFTLGTGLSGWSGLTRFASPAVGTILGLDAPLYQQVTNGINDQFLRKLSIYAKGKFGKFDYRFALSKPMTAQNSSIPLETLNKKRASFSLRPPKVQTQGYVMAQLFDQEDNTLAYTNGTYYGKKKILTVGVGFIGQENAMWKLNDAGDTTNINMVLFGADVFYEQPLSEKHNTITAYAAYTSYDMGQNYVRSSGAMNPANTVNSQGTFNGAGNAAPIIGTGQTIYAQAGYRFKDNLLGDHGTFQVYGSMQYSLFEALKEPVMIYEGGLSWLMYGDHHSKLTLAYQSRPIYTLDGLGDLIESDRKGMLTLQYQIAF